MAASFIVSVKRSSLRFIWETPVRVAVPVQNDAPIPPIVAPKDLQRCHPNASWSRLSRAPAGPPAGWLGYRKWVAHSDRIKARGPIEVAGDAVGGYCPLRKSDSCDRDCVRTFAPFYGQWRELRPGGGNVLG
jgi:hypothetical protein